MTHVFRTVGQKVTRQVSGANDQFRLVFVSLTDLTSFIITPLSSVELRYLQSDQIFIEPSKMKISIN